MNEGTKERTKEGRNERTKPRNQRTNDQTKKGGKTEGTFDPPKYG